jgi:hypothetical protein
LSTPVGRKRSIEYQETIIEFSRISQRLFMGFNCKDWFCMASPEKAILDTLYYRRALPAHDELKLENVDFNILGKMAESYPKFVHRAVRSILDAVYVDPGTLVKG